MNEEYDIVYCKGCNSVKITESDKSCLICGKESIKIGFEHRVIQDLLKVEENNG